MTTAIQEKKILTAEEYLQMERTGLREKIGKHEFFSHKLIFMAGASNNHNLVTKNLVSSSFSSFFVEQLEKPK